MNYSIVLSKRTEKQLDKLSDKIVQPILEKITDLGKNPRPAGYKKLKGRHGYRV
jgi:mRNA interferase RelE/StbE